MNFVHLRTYSYYSLGHGIIHIDELIKQNSHAVALTDKHNCFGWLEFSIKALKRGIQPIVGSVIMLKHEKYEGEILLLVKNRIGYENLISISSQSFEHKPPYITIDILKKHSEGLILLAGNEASSLFSFNTLNESEIRKLLIDLEQIFKDHFYIEIIRESKNKKTSLENKLLKYAIELNIPIVATNGASFMSPEDVEAADVALCITTQKYLAEENREKVNPEFYLKSETDMSALFSDIPEAITNSVLIAKRCSYFPTEQKITLPQFSEDDEATITKITWENLKEKGFETNQLYIKRLEYELSTIKAMGFSGYFLIVADFINWSKKNNIPVGPGRGSGAGSLVAWLLGITSINPLTFSLLFERFLNPERVSLPDFDIDFCQERRNEVIQYISNKYGKDKIAAIITFGKLQARAAIRDVGRVLQVPYHETDKICKMIPINPANPVTLKQAVDLDKELTEKAKSDAKLEKLIKISLLLEGITKNVSIHAAGIVISKDPLLKMIPLCKTEDNNLNVVQYSMKYTELAGLLKFDFLGLKTLTVLSKTCKKIKENHNIEIDLESLPYTDKKTFDMLSNGMVMGVFQFESAGMRESIKRLQPDTIGDLIALCSLYRPGPMDNIPLYINRKHGLEKVEYPHPKLEEILKETYGIIIYQEQVMEIFRVLASYSLAEADLVRRAMGKKIKKEMEQQRKIFIEKATANKITKSKAEEIFNLVNKFASYGFNKSHAAAYSVISYHTAYLKTHYTIEFILTLLNVDIDDTDKINIYLREAQCFSIKILPPDINKSLSFFSQEGNNIRFGLLALKNVSKTCASHIENVRNKSFLSLEDFLTKAQELKKRSLESLIKAGALDTLHKNRKELLLNIENLLAFSTKKSERNIVQFSLFQEEEVKNKLQLTQYNAWNYKELSYNEFQAFGFYFFSNPIYYYKKFIDTKFCTIEEVLSADNNCKAKFNIVGVIMSRKVRSTPKGRYAFLQLADQDNVLDVSLFDESLLVRHDAELYVGNSVFMGLEIKPETLASRILVTFIKPLEKFIKYKNYLITLDNKEAVELLHKNLTSQGHKIRIEAKIKEHRVRFTSNTNNKDYYIDQNALELLENSNLMSIIELPCISY